MSCCSDVAWTSKRNLDVTIVGFNWKQFLSHGSAGAQVQNSTWTIEQNTVQSPLVIVAYGFSIYETWVKLSGGLVGFEYKLNNDVLFTVFGTRKIEPFGVRIID